MYSSEAGAKNSVLTFLSEQTAKNEKLLQYLIKVY